MGRNNIKHILFFFDSRATFAYANNVFQEIKNEKKIKCSTLISGNYLDKKMGVGLDIFKKNKIKITKKANFLSSNKKKDSWARNLGLAVTEYSKKISEINPDLILITGDRIETIAACLTATYLNIPIAHIQAGDKSGHVDDVARAAIAKMAHIHLASCKDSAQRLLRWGENKKRVFNVGAPQLDDIHVLLKNYKRKKRKTKKIIIIFHPVLNEIKNFKQNILSLYKALKKFKYDYFWIYPNNDYGYKILINFLKDKKSQIKVIKNLDRDKFLKFLLEIDAIIGNSSSGIIESPSFKIPVINIGTRQRMRPQSVNIVNSSYNNKDIENKMNFIFNNKNFKNNLKKTKNIYFQKNSSKKIVSILKKLSKNDNLLRKF